MALHDAGLQSDESPPVRRRGLKHYMENTDLIPKIGRLPCGGVD